MVGVVTLFIFLMVGLVIVASSMKLISWRRSVVRAWEKLIELERNKYRLIPVLERALEPYPDYQFQDHHCMSMLRASLERLCPEYVNPDLIDDIEQQSEQFVNEFVEAVNQHPEIAKTEAFERIYDEFLRKQNTLNAAISCLSLRVEHYNRLLSSFHGRILSRFIKTGWTFCENQNSTVSNQSVM